MRNVAPVLSTATALWAASSAYAVTPVQCLQTQTSSSGDAVLSNQCSNPLNLLYCVDSVSAERACAAPSPVVITLHYGVPLAISGYSAAGKPAIHSAVCFYPEAPINWRPGSTEYSCKKTCVMC